MPRFKILIPRHVSVFDSDNTMRACLMQILAIRAIARNACITGDLPTAEELLTQEIDADGDNYNSYANRSFVMARKLHWDRALHDAIKVRYTDPSCPILADFDGVIVCQHSAFIDRLH